MSSENEWKERSKVMPTWVEGHVYIGTGIHGLCLFTWNDRAGVWDFKHRRACWWEKPPITTSIDKWRYPLKPLFFGHRADLWEGPDIGNL